LGQPLEYSHEYTMKSSRHFTLYALFTALLCLGHPAADASNIAYIYDAAGRLITTDYGTNRTTSFAYDNAGNLLQSATPAPGLTVRVSGNQLTLSWSASPGGFVLQNASSIDSGALWTNVGITNAQSGNFNSATLNLGGATTFYRLKK
jgi:YD repeat-containing protein